MVFCRYKDCSEMRQASKLAFFPFPKDFRQAIWQKHAESEQIHTGICVKHFYKKYYTIIQTKIVTSKSMIPMSRPSVCQCSETVLDGACAKLMGARGLAFFLKNDKTIKDVTKLPPDNGEAAKRKKVANPPSPIVLETTDEPMIVETHEINLIDEISDEDCPGVDNSEANQMLCDEILETSSNNEDRAEENITENITEDSDVDMILRFSLKTFETLEKLRPQDGCDAFAKNLVLELRKLDSSQRQRALVLIGSILNKGTNQDLNVFSCIKP